MFATWPPALPHELQHSMRAGRLPFDLHCHDAKQQDLQHTVPHWHAALSVDCTA